MPESGHAKDHAIIDEFLDRYFGSGFMPEPLADEEQRLITQVLDWVERQFNRMRYAVGVALDFTLLAQRLSQVDPAAKRFRSDLTWADIEHRYERIARRGETLANTLTLAYGGHAEGIRTIEEAVLGLFRKLDRPGYSSAYVYNTGQWQKYTNVLVDSPADS